MYGYGGYCGYAQPVGACCGPVGGFFGNAFVLIVVLFILLIIIGTCCWLA
ncbi:YjcZ family sporulation protein [Bacillus sp. FJAT-27245]|nr:YjcZ family sporulation protein [Bacillus sp. FJAT-27245]